MIDPLYIMAGVDFAMGCVSVIAVAIAERRGRRINALLSDLEVANDLITAWAQDEAIARAEATFERNRADGYYRRLVRHNVLTAPEKADHFRKLGAIGNANRKRQKAVVE